MYEKIEATAQKNTKKVLDAFRRHKVAEMHLVGSTGYGYNDAGRETLDRVWADVFESEAAFVRGNIASGTHAIMIGLFGLLRPGDLMLSVTGQPYDTLTGAIGIKNNGADTGSLRDFGVRYAEIPLTGNKNSPVDIAAMRGLLQREAVKVVFLQKSKGYAERVTLSNAQIGEVVRAVKLLSPDTYVVVDNCYGEFTEEHEPCYFGADMAIGSLIKNPGGGIAESGGYICGTQKAVALASYRLTVPPVGLEVGATLGTTRGIFKGLYFAPHVVAQALKTAVYAAEKLGAMGYNVSPGADEERYDIIQTVRFGAPGPMIRFIQGIQGGSAVDAHATPEPWEMPGYDCEVIMASGSFTQGSSIEISADAPVRAPYTAFLQGGLTFEAGKIAVDEGIKRIIG